MSGLTREMFLKSATKPTEDVPLPELGEGVFVRVVGFTAKERTAFENSLLTKKGQPIEARKQQIRERLLVACCFDEDGKPLFTEADIEAIGNQNAALVERIVNVAMRLVGMTGTDVETLAKN